QRRRGRELAHQPPGDAEAWMAAEFLADDEPLSLAVEDAEVAAVLGRALATLPPTTRRALEAAYIRELPQAEVAQTLLISEAALRVRLHRGKHALRQALTGTLRDEAVAAGLALPEASGWQTTRVWCPWCGRHHLEWQVDQASGWFGFRCEGKCTPDIRHIGAGALPDGLTSPKSILAQLCLRLGGDYRQALSTGRGVCPKCGRAVRVWQMQEGDHRVTPLGAHGIVLVCEVCSTFDGASPWHLTLDTAEALRFWRRHPRMRALPTRAVERDGRPALLTGFESIDASERLRIISARDTYELLHVTGDER
ncbi:MAG TPA: RNA polymerase sigma factor, partial [Ktedonobacterales bacterium]